MACSVQIESRRWWLKLCIAIALLGYGIGSVRAQAPPGADAPPQAPPGGAQGSFDTFPGFGGGMPGDAFGGGDKRVTLDAKFQVEKGTTRGELSVHAAIQPGWHIYSTTQPAGGPIRSTLKIIKPPTVKLTGPFEPDHDPMVHHDPAFPDIAVEEYSGDVTWTAPIELPAGTDPEKLEIEVEYNGQACVEGGACELVNGEKATAKFAGYLPTKTASGAFETKDSHIVIHGYIEPKVTAAGSTVNLVLSAKLKGDWHIYAYAPTDPNKVSKPTLIVLRKTSGFQHGPPQANTEPIAEETGLKDEPVVHYHKKQVTWTVPIEVPVGTKPGKYPIAGSIAYLTCTPAECDKPTGLDFDAEIVVGPKRVAGQIPLTFRPTDYKRVAKLAVAAQMRAEKQVKTAATKNWIAGKSRWTILGLAFLAGLILNVMPCVLPVLGLKLMAFVQQAGGKRSEIFALNLWFSLGLLFVFWILATLAAAFRMGWGAQFNNAAFTITMTALVFAFGLALLGVWQVPIPGFMGSGTVQKMAEREGAAGAFSKGIFTTLLATPCAGPLVIPLISWTISQPPWLTYLLFTSMGLGMASPYLLVGAFPQLMRLLPKPGDWMTTFEQVLGFVLMGTAVFLLNSLPQDLIIPTVTLLVGISVACWWIGRTPVTADLFERLRSWGTAIAMIVFFSWFSFSIVKVDKNQQLPWERFSRAVLDKHLKEGRTVMVDFTADW